MASMSDTPRASAEVRLKRFLHYGSEENLCVPGDRFLLQCFALDKLSAVEEMLANCAPHKQDEAVNCVMKAFMDGYSAYPECLVFALAVCVTQKLSEPLRAKAYNAVKTVCKTPKDIFLFVAFTKKLSSPTSGSGNGWRKALTDWYLSKKPLELAECVTRCRGAYGFRHKDIFKLIHIKSSDKAKQAIISYVFNGLEAAKKLPDIDSPAVQEVLSYLHMVEDIKHQTDVQAAARLMECHKLTLEIAQSDHLKSAEVWLSVVPTMPLKDLLTSLVRLSCLGLIKPKQPLASCVADRLLDKTAIVESHLHPTEVFCAMKYYENHAKNTFEQMEKLIKQGKVTMVLKPAAKPNPLILDALNKLMTRTFELLVPTGMRYLIALDLSSNMKTWKCNGSRDVKPAEAAILLALCLLHAEKEVTVVGFPALPGAPPEEDLIDPVNPIVQAVSRKGKKKGSGGPLYPRKTELRPMVPLSLDITLSVAENLEKLSEIATGPVEVCQPMVWAEQIQKPVDVFIVLTDYVTLRKREFRQPALALQDYRQHMNMPNSKLVTSALVSNTLDVAAKGDTGMLDIVGFNGQVAKVIEAFSRGAF